MGGIGREVKYTYQPFFGPERLEKYKYKYETYFIIYWIALGIASSIGLGTGLHTFVLYLGPRIAKIAMQAYVC